MKLWRQGDCRAQRATVHTLRWCVYVWCVRSVVQGVVVWGGVIRHLGHPVRGWARVYFCR